MSAIYLTDTKVETNHSTWLRSPRWDIFFLVASVVIALLPYSMYILAGGNFTSAADQVGTAEYNSRLMINTIVLAFIGGPHMYATFTRTMMDPVTFKKKKNLYIITSILVPIFVFAMAVYSYDTYVWLMTIFFGMASLHALQQVIWICGAYDLKSGRKVSLWSKLIDYGIVFSSLYPIPIMKMVNQDFKIGPVPLKANDIVGGWYWLAYLVTAFFLVMLVLFIGKTIMEIAQQRVHWGKTLLIIATVIVMIGMMFLPNLDTAAQGINTWHSFQYLALTWLAHRVVQIKKGKELGFMHFWRNLYSQAKDLSSSRWGMAKNMAVGFTTAMRKVDQDTGWSSFYMLTIAMLPVSSVIVILAARLLPNLHVGMPGADEVYTYMGILSILLIHYVHDAFLFTDHEDLVLEYNDLKQTAA